MMEAQNLAQAMTWAQKIEDKNKVLDQVREAKSGRGLLSENMGKSLAYDWGHGDWLGRIKG